MTVVFITNLELGTLGEGRVRVAFPGEAENRVPDIHHIEDFKWSAVYERDTVFVLDIHFRYKRQEHEIKLQDQGGVDVYRHLLAHYAGTGQTLRVIFYTPIPQTELVRLKPENYVLSFLPFVEGAYTDSFAGKLEQAMAVQDWPQFNNASENLLSGWALKNKERIREGLAPEAIGTEGRRVAVIDDEMPEWETVYRAMLGDEGFFPLGYDKAMSPTGVFSMDKLGADTENKIRTADLVLADLYLEERHETTRWMSGEQLEDVSGFKLFDLVKGTEDEQGLNPGIPYMLRTSSSKVNYFRHFEARDCDAWFVKDIRANAPNAEKRAHYELFAESLRETLTGDNGMLYSRLTAIWQAIQWTEAHEDELWWHDRCEERGMVINTLKAVWLGLRAFMGRGTAQYDRLSAYDEHVIVPAAYITLLGQLSEAIQVDDNYQNFVFKALKSVRHCGAHFRKDSEVRAEDGVLCMELWLLVLNATDIDKSLLKRYRDRSVNNEENPRFVNVFFTDRDARGKVRSITYLKNQLLCTYLQLYNYDHGEMFEQLRPALTRRIEALFRQSDKASLARDIVAHEPVYVDDQRFALKKLGETIGYGLTMDKVQRKGLNLDEKNGKIRVVHG